MTQAVLFDNDGVLVETENLYFDASRETLAEAGVDLTLQLYQEISLRRGQNLMDLASERGLTTEAIDELRQRRDDRYAARLQAGVTVLPGARETVERLLGEGKRLAIVTTCPGAHFAIQHRQTGLLSHFEVVLVREDYPKAKPHPDGYATAVRRLGLTPGDCVAIEDTQRGVEAAVAAGVRCFAVASPLTHGTDFERHEALLDSVAQLPDAIAALDAAGCP